MRGRVLACGVIAAVFAAWGSAPAPGQAATVYRCGADGRTFSQTPCPVGDGTPMTVTDERDASQRAEAQDAARRTAAAADSMAVVRERLDAQRVRAPGIIPVMRATPGDERRSGKAAKKNKRHEEDGLTVPFKGAPADDGDRKKPAAAR